MQILFLLLIFPLFIQGCNLWSKSSNGDRAGNSGTPQGGTPSGAVGALTTNVAGFSSWGGIASSDSYRHLSDPAGIVSGSVYSEEGSFKGSSGINPSEVLSQP